MALSETPREIKPGVRYKFDDFLNSAISFEKYLRQYKARKISKKERIKLNCILAEIIENL